MTSEERKAAVEQARVIVVDLTQPDRGGKEVAGAFFSAESIAVIRNTVESLIALIAEETLP